MINHNLFTICFFFLITFCSCQTKEENKIEKSEQEFETIAQIEPVVNNTVITEMSQAYGFKIGQDYSLEMIEKKYPDLKPQIQIAKLKFDKSFGNSISTIDSILLSKGNEWLKIKTQLNDQIKSSVNLSNYNYDQIKDFVQSVEARANGEIPVPIIGTFLTFNPTYLKSPTLEFTDGFKYRFSSKDNLKAKGVDFHLDLPQSWLAKEGNRPNIVQKFVSQNGHGSTMALVLVLELPEVNSISEEDIKELAQSEESKEMLPKNSQFLNSGFIKIDGLPGIYQEYKIRQTQIDNELLMHTINYNVYYKNKMISIQCSVGAASDDENKTDAVFVKYKELFKSIAGSLVVQSQWKK
ncbi:MAG: hypothetical protein IT277_04480 [Ignavibacteriaceae bacterium]|nr:hypothetical protein [Ignavibacteriaceae bacterium]